jgi:hypothetical protein
MGEATVTGPPSNLFTAVVKAVRPRQWVKNLLVFAAPLAALGGPDTYDYRTVLGRVSVAFVVFCMAASSARSRPECCRSESPTASRPPWRRDAWPSRGG